VKITIILTCVGGGLSSQLIKLIKESNKYKIEVIGTDVHSSATGRYFCDKFFKVPKGDDPVFIESILNIAQKNNADLIIPTSDEEALSLSANKERFENICKLATVDFEKIEILNSKIKTYKFLEENDIPVPLHYGANNKEELMLAIKKIRKERAQFIVKPSESRGSRDIFLFESCNEKRINNFLEKKLNKIASSFPFIVMEKLNTPIVDIDILGLDGDPISVIPRMRVNPLNPNEGHIFLENHECVNLGKKIIKKFNLSWLYDCDVMFDDKNNPMLLEINPRPSGSVAVSICGGSPLVDNLISIAKGNKVEKISNTSLQNKKIISFNCLKKVEL